MTRCARVQACHIAYADGFLVIPTNAGAVFGVDLISGSLAWAYPYGERPGAADQPEQPELALPARPPRLDVGQQQPSAHRLAEPVAGDRPAHPGRQGRLQRPGRPRHPLHQPA